MLFAGLEVAWAEFCCRDSTGWSEAKETDCTAIDGTGVGLSKFGAD